MADYVIAGSGINALVAASLLARKGRKVLVLERNAAIGGCIRSEEATVPGFVHDVMATTFVMTAHLAFATFTTLCHACGMGGGEFGFADTAIFVGVDFTKFGFVFGFTIGGIDLAISIDVHLGEMGAGHRRHLRLAE